MNEKQSFQNKNSNSNSTNDLNINVLPDNVLSRIFTFFNPKEQSVLAVVSKRWNAVVHDKFTAMKTYEGMKVLAPEKQFLPIKYFMVANKRLHTSREDFMKKLENLPYYYGNITRQEAEIILLSANQENCFLIRASSKEGFIALSMLCDEKRINEDDSGTLMHEPNRENNILLEHNKRYKASLIRNNQNKKSEKTIVPVHALYSVYEDTDKAIKIKQYYDDPAASVEVFPSVELFDLDLRMCFGNPLIRDDSSSISYNS